MAKITYTVTDGSPPTISPNRHQIELRQGDFVEFTRALATAQPISVTLAGAGGAGPSLLCVVPEPPHQAVTVSVVPVGANIVIRFTAAALPSPPPPLVFRDFNFLVSATGNLTPSAPPSFVSGAVLNFRPAASLIGSISVELTASGPNLFFEIAPARPKRRVRMTDPSLVGSSIVIAIADAGGADAGRGPLP